MLWSAIKSSIDWLRSDQFAELFLEVGVVALEGEEGGDDGGVAGGEVGVGCEEGLVEIGAAG